jgi:hypothetical protein
VASYGGWERRRASDPVSQDTGGLQTIVPWLCHWVEQSQA